MSGGPDHRPRRGHHPRLVRLGEATARPLTADRVALLASRADRIHPLPMRLGDGAIAIQADVADRTLDRRRCRDELQQSIQASGG